MKNRGLGYERSLLLLLGSLSMFLYGTIYSWSIFIEPLETEFSWSRSQVTMAYSIGMVALYIGMTLHGVLASKKSSRYSMLLGASLILAGYSTASRIGPDMQDIARLLVLWLSYGVCGGLGVGICYNGWLTTVVERLPDRPGLASGLLLMGMGIGGFASAQAADLMIRSFGMETHFTRLRPSNGNDVTAFHWVSCACNQRHFFPTAGQAGRFRCRPFRNAPEKVFLGLYAVEDGTSLQRFRGDRASSENRCRCRCKSVGVFRGGGVAEHR